MLWRWKNAFPKSHLADQPRHTRFERSSSCRHFNSDSVIASLRPEGTPWRWKNAFLKSYLLDSPIHTSFERSSARRRQVPLPERTAQRAVPAAPCRHAPMARVDSFTGQSVGLTEGEKLV